MTMAYGIIYLATCITTGLKYVGQTTGDIQRRWRGHCDAAKKGSTWKLSEAIREYGSESFQLKVLCECDSAQTLNETETKLIQDLNVVWPNGYNMKTTSGRVMCEEMRQKISQRTREAMANCDQTWKKRQRQAMEDLEVRQKISDRTQSALKRPEVQENFQRMIADPENKKKISESTKLAMRDPAVREKHLAGIRKRKGLKLSDETKEKIRNSLKARNIEKTFSVQHEIDHLQGVTILTEG
jgi:group I intron endonuclease